MKQATERGYSVQEVAKCLGTTTHSLYAWRKQYGTSEDSPDDSSNKQAEIVRLKTEFKRVTEERDIIKKAAAYFAKESQ